MNDLTGESLDGGNMDPVIRIGDTVRRVSGPWTPSVHSLLRHYAEAGITQVPRAFGLDGDGREMLSYIPGETMVALSPEEQWSPTLLDQAARLLRRLHDASTPLIETDSPWRMESHYPVQVICHNDFAPYNLIASEGQLAGAIDFDMASPGPRLWDLSYLAYRLVPFAEDAEGFDEERDGTRDNRLAALLDAYRGDVDPAEVRPMIARRLVALAEFSERRAQETGRTDLLDHASMYRRDAARMHTG